MKKNIFKKIYIFSFSVLLTFSFLSISRKDNINNDINIIETNTSSTTKAIEKNPIISNTFSWINVTSHHAEFSFSYYVNDPAYVQFDAEHDVVLLWDKNADGAYTDDEVFETIEEEVDNGGHYRSSGKDEGIEYVSTIPGEGDSANISTSTYKVKGLKPNTRYSNFAIYLNPGADTLVVEDITSDPSYYILFNDMIDDDGKNVPSYFVTASDPTVFYLVILLLLMVLIVVALVFLAIKWFMWWNKHMRLAVYFDGRASYAEGELILSLLHVNKNPILWNSHESDLVFIAAGRPIDAMFRRDQEIDNGYRIYITENTAAKRVVLSLISASRYNKFSIGVKGTKETFHATALSEERAQRVVKAVSKSDQERYEETREMILMEIAKKHERNKQNVATEGKGHNIISAISDKKSRNNSLRYQVLFPSSHPQLETFDPHAEHIAFYHLYNGKLYKMEHKFVAQYGSMFEYDLINLNPESIYVGLSTTIYCKKGEILPSASLYGITRDPHGALPNKTEATLGKPSEGAEGLDIWSIDAAFENLGKEQFYRMFEIITKKHYEDENFDSYMPTLRAKEFHDDYIFKWLRETHRDFDIRRVEEIYGLDEEKEHKEDLQN